MKPYIDTPHAYGHVNAMMQERYAQAGGPSNRTVTAFAEDIVKTLPLIPGASVITLGAMLPSGNILTGSGRGIGFSSMQLNDQVTGATIWAAPRYLSPLDYLTQRTIGPGAYLHVTPAVAATGPTAGQAIMSDFYNLWSFDAESGAVNWVRSQDDWPPGPQRIREEPLRDQSASNDAAVGITMAPVAVKAPSGAPVVGSLYTRGNFYWADAANGDLLVAQNGDVGNVAKGVSQPILFALIDLLCFPGGQLSLEFKDWCSGFVYTRYYSANTTMHDPIRNRVTVTYAGDGETYDRFMTWSFCTNNDPNPADACGNPGTILTDADLSDSESPGMRFEWSSDFGLNSGSTPTWSDSGAVIFGVDGAGVTNAFDANTGNILASSTGGAAGFSPSTDHDDLLVVCSGTLGLVQSSPVDGSILFANTSQDLGIQHLPVVPDAPLLAQGRPEAECVGFPGTYADVYSAQFVVGYPISLLAALKGAGIPVPISVQPRATVDFQADRQTGATIPATYRSVYNGSGEASHGATDAGRFISGRVDAMASINAVLFNLILPARFDIPPAEGGWVISEPRSWREAVVNQFQGAARYCDEVLNGRVLPDGTLWTAPLPIVVNPDYPDSCGGLTCDPLVEGNKERQLQLNVNKVGYINSIVKNSLLFGRSPVAVSKGEISAAEESVLLAAIGNLQLIVGASRALLLSNAPGNPVRSVQTQARTGLERACQIIDRTIDLLERNFECVTASDCDDFNDCTIDSCSVIGLCRNDINEGASCENGTGICNADGVCEVTGELCEGVVCEDLGECISNTCNPATGLCEASDVQDGTACTGGTCQAGECVPTNPCSGVTCDDLGECISNECDPATGLCEASNVQDGTACDGGNGSCRGGACVPNDLCAGVDCDDLNECTTNDCDPATGQCINDSLPPGTPCGDGGYCATGDVCADGSQTTANALVCSPLGFTLSLPLEVTTSLSSVPNPGGTVNMTNRVRGVNVALAAVGLEPALQQDNSLISADFEITVMGGTPTLIALSDPNVPRPIADGFTIDTGDKVTAVKVDGGATMLTTILSDAQVRVAALGGIVLVTVAPGRDACVLDADDSVFPVVGPPAPECERDRDCDDDNECTIDSCSDQACNNVVDAGSSCGGLLFGGKGVCSAVGVCEPPTDCNRDRDCEDGNECTNDTCENDQCVYTVRDGERCGGLLDEKFCNAEGVCEDPTNPVECKNDRDCKDSNECTDNICSSGQCFNPVLPGESCGGLIFENGVCDPDGQCIEATGCTSNRACNDNNECTIDTCNAETGECVNTVDEGAQCGGVFGNSVCDANGQCVDLGCQVDEECFDFNECTTDACVDGTCQNTNNEGADCSIGTCDANATCVCAVDRDCDDDQECTIDSCVGGACSNVPDTGSSCGGLIFFGGKGVCSDAGTCEPPTTCNRNGDCEDDNECTDDTCQSGACVYNPVDGKRCGGLFDDNFCDAEGVCRTEDGQVGCQNDRNCDDGNECTVDECVRNVCSNLIDEGASCGALGSGDVCDASGTCQTPGGPSGECERDRDCADGNQCTQDICSNGECFNPADTGAFCGGLVNIGTCNADAECIEQRRCAFDFNCGDGNPCTRDECRILLTGICQYPPADSTNECGPGLFPDGMCDGEGMCILECTFDSQCNEVGDPCRTGTCEADGFCSFQTNPGAVCSRLGTNGTCSVDGSCIEVGRCVADLDCEDFNDCTFDQCDYFAVNPGEVATCEFPPKPEGARCGTLGTGRCDGNGTCLD